MNGGGFDGVHKCEITQATGYGCYDPFELEWSSIVCKLLGIPMKALPKVFPTTSRNFGRFEKYGIPIKAICGDANAAMVGEGRFKFYSKKKLLSFWLFGVNFKWNETLKGNDEMWRYENNYGNWRFCRFEYWFLSHCLNYR